MLFQIPLLNQLAQMQPEGVAIGGQKSYCVGNSEPATLPGDGQHLFLQRCQLLQELFALDLTEQDIFLLFQAGQEETQPVIQIFPFASDQLL
jgi:hypothetical protein